MKDIYCEKEDKRYFVQWKYLIEKKKYVEFSVIN